MRRTRRGSVMAVAVGATMAVLLAACGGGGGDDVEVQSTSGGAVGTLDDVQGATVQIVATGSLRDPEVGMSSSAGSGSGFFVNDEGLVVTNNHVVTGAGTLEVFIGGEGEGLPASIIGVSECNDLALLQVDVDQPTPFLGWYSDEIRPGVDVYAAGFPLGDPEFTLTRGIVSKAEADGDITGTSSVEHTIEHDAAIQPGNSGGPLVTGDGQVVGVNYAGGAFATTTEQFFAIAADLARDVVVELEDGDVESIGINGWAVDDGEGLAGIWVAGVAAGSPASRAGLLPGDIVTTLNGVPMGVDGTFADYCDVLRTAGDRAMSVEVLRFDTEEVLRGEINGDLSLSSAYSFAQEIEGQTGLDTGSAYDSYVTLTDDTGTITVDVPEAWTDVDTTPAIADDGSEIPYIAASTSIAEFETTYNVPGVVFVAGESTLTPDAGLVEFAPAAGECTDGGIFDYADSRFAGRYQVWEDCAGTTAVYVVLVSQATDVPGFVFVTVVQAVTEADLEVIDQVFATFNFVG